MCDVAVLLEDERCKKSCVRLAAAATLNNIIAIITYSTTFLFNI